jgi:hypothetical protein
MSNRVELPSSGVHLAHVYLGDFARHGHVSVRMLRDYDEIGLLQPAYFDQVTGSRYYDAHAGLTPAGPAIAYYEDPPDGDGVIVHATVPVDATPDEDPDFAMIGWLAGSTPMDTAQQITTASCI